MNMTRKEQIMKNAQLFVAIRKPRPLQQKILKITKHLKDGADINTRDANDNNNTPLHVAVLEADAEIVKLLLCNGAKTDTTNDDGRTPLDVEVADPVIKNILKDNTNQVQTVTEQCIVQESGNKITSIENYEMKQKLENNINFISNKTTYNMTEYKKRSGTAGIRGQLYETKLLSLVLLKLLNDPDVQEFYLGTNIAEVGAFDDLILKLKINNKTKLLFVQAKHREDTEKNKVTLQEILKPSGNFSLYKYFNSYMDIRNHFNIDSKSIIFNDSYKNLNCNFIIYTSAHENFNKKKFSGDKYNTRADDILYTCENGKTFQYAYEENDLDLLVNTALEMRIKRIANCLTNGKITEDIKAYRVYLAQNVCNTTERKLHSAFLNTDDKVLSTLRGEIYEEVLKHLKKPSIAEIKDLINILAQTPTADTLSTLIDHVIKFDVWSGKLQLLDKKVTEIASELETILNNIIIKPETVRMAQRLAEQHRLELVTVQLPSNFVNLTFEVKTESRLHELGAVLVNLMTNATEDDICKIVYITDEMIRNNNVLTKDMCLKCNGGIAGLVGNLLVLDLETDYLKFNDNEESLCSNSRKVLAIIKEKLKKEELKCYRFDINVKGFPLLSLIDKRKDRALVANFFDCLYFYTNQAKENEVEKIIKDKIDLYYKTTTDTYEYHIKCDAIFQVAHKFIQSWWMNPHGFYLTKECDFFDKAKYEIIESPVLTKLRLVNLEYKCNVIECLGMNKACNSKDKTILISTDEILLTSFKVIQYFKMTMTKYELIDFTLFKKNYLETALPRSGLIKTNFILIVIVDEFDSSENFCTGLARASEIFIKVFLIMDTTSSKWFQKQQHESYEYYEVNDVKTVFDHLSIETQNQINNKSIVFQGVEIKLGEIVNEKIMQYFNSKSLVTILKNDRIEIGKKSISSPRYDDDVKDYYVTRSICRHVKLKNIENIRTKWYVIEEGKSSQPKHANKNQEIIVIYQNDQYYKNHNDSFKDNFAAVHWFKKINTNFVWIMSQGGTNHLAKFVEREENRSFEIEPNDIKDLYEDVVIVSAEPGMGKSSLLSHLANVTKRKYPQTWIIRADLRKYLRLFEEWQKQKSVISIAEVVKFLCQVAELKMNNFMEELPGGEMKWIDDVCKIEQVDDSNQVTAKFGKKLDNSAELELDLFICLYNQGQLSLLLDGFDEIYADCKYEVKTLFNTFKNMRYDKLWVTTRTYSCNDLENIFGTFSYTLGTLSPKSQYQVLERFWSRSIDFQNLRPREITRFVNLYFDKVSLRIFDKDKKFTSLPLNLYMIAVILHDEFQEIVYKTDAKTLGLVKFDPMVNSNMDLSLNLLYQRFVDVLFKIRYEDKMPPNLSGMGIKKLLSKEQIDIYERHKMLAAFVIFGPQKLKLFCWKQEINCIYDLIEELRLEGESTGIIEEVTGKEPKFVHFTYAEYFATEFLCDKLKTSRLNSKWNLLADSVIFSKSLLRIFFNGKLSEDPELAALSSGQRNKSSVFKILKTEQIYTPHEKVYHNPTPSSALLVAIGERLLHVTTFLLGSVESYLSKDNLEDFIKVVISPSYDKCPLCLAVTNDWKTVTSTIIEAVAKVDASKVIYLLRCGDTTNALLEAVFAKRDQEFVNMFLKPLKPKELLTIFKIPFYSNRVSIIHYAVRANTLNLLVPYLEKLDNTQRMEIFSLTDSYGRLPAHDAAFVKNFSIFEIMSTLLNKKQFKKVCLTASGDGSTPLEYFDTILSHNDADSRATLDQLKNKVTSKD